ncbi:MAG: hypothetical protein HY815_04085 [Candidatus Riflebacteria bacterium]|nr:hypothetical protein [Candidatus Riflebacteria bacterium]
MGIDLSRPRSFVASARRLIKTALVVWFVFGPVLSAAAVAESGPPPTVAAAARHPAAVRATALEMASKAPSTSRASPSAVSSAALPAIEQTYRAMVGDEILPRICSRLPLPRDLVIRMEPGEEGHFSGEVLDAETGETVAVLPDVATLPIPREERTFRFSRADVRARQELSAESEPYAAGDPGLVKGILMARLVFYRVTPPADVTVEVAVDEMGRVSSARVVEPKLQPLLRRAVEEVFLSQPRLVESSMMEKRFTLKISKTELAALARSSVTVAPAPPPQEPPTSQLTPARAS